MGTLYWEPRDSEGNVKAGHFRATVAGALLLVWRQGEKQWRAEVRSIKPKRRLAISIVFEKRRQAVTWALNTANSPECDGDLQSFGNYANTRRASRRSRAGRA